MDQEIQILVDLLAALGTGILIGIERGWIEQKDGDKDRIVGIRGFAMAGLLGGLWAEIAAFLNDWILAIVFAAFAILIAAAQLQLTKAHDDTDVDITTSIALLITFSLGAWAAFGHHIHALGTAVVVTAILSLKPVLRRWLNVMEVQEIHAGIKFLAISVILLPLLPDKGYGPWNALNPYWIWWMVVLISGLSFLGHVLIKYKGERLGTMLTAFTGGFISSTAVTMSMAEFASQKKTRPNHLFIAGLLVASSIMLVRVAIEVSVVNPALLHPLWIPLAVMLLLTAGGGFWLWRKYRGQEQEEPPIELNNPLQMTTALQFGLLLAVIMVLATAMKEWFGDEGIYILSIFSGLMDVDAITLSLSRMALDEISSSIAIVGIVISVITNTLVKAGIFIFWVGVKKNQSLIWIILAIIIMGILSLLPFVM